MRLSVVRIMHCAVPGLLVLIAACWSAGSAAAVPLSPPCTVEARLSCTPHEHVSQQVRPWRHRRSRVVVRSGAPNHSVQDVLVIEGRPITVEGKFNYGRALKDLEDEPIFGFLNTADGWISLGEKSTNRDGRVSFTIEPPLRIGVYDVRLYVGGDASVAAARLWVLPPGTRLAIFDIDGTLTTGDEEIIRDVKNDLFFPLLRKEYVPRAYPGADLLTTAQATRGHVNVYLTGRPYWLANTTRRWLKGPPSFAPGVLHVTDSNEEAIPKREGVGAFKLSFLKKLVDAGFLLDVAYGNATTDIYAYLGAGLPPAAVWIIGQHGGGSGTHAVNGSWEERVRGVSALPVISQPWQ